MYFSFKLGSFHWQFNDVSIPFLCHLGIKIIFQVALRRQQAQEENEQRQIQSLMLNANLPNISNPANQLPNLPPSLKSQLQQANLKHNSSLLAREGETPTSESEEINITTSRSQNSSPVMSQNHVAMANVGFHGLGESKSDDEANRLTRKRTLEPIESDSGKNSTSFFIHFRSFW